MRIYAYRCQSGHVFEQEGNLDDDVAYCACGDSARRRPFTGAPYIQGETVARAIPDVQYRQEAERRELHENWGGADRAAEMVRGAVTTNEQGDKYLDMSRMET